jgi:regulatory protein
VRRRPRVERPSGSAPRPSTRTAALNLLGRRDYTTAELRSRLADRGYPPVEIQAVSEEFEAKHLLDDRRVAAAFVRTAVAIKGRGRLRIERELRARGVAPALAHELVAAVGPDDEERTIRAILAKKRFPSRPSPAERRRMFAHLLRRGFPAAVVIRALRMPAPADEGEG